MSGTGLNRVMIEVEVPEATWVRGDCILGEQGRMQYAAKFCRSGTSPRAVHMGPVVSVVVTNPQGKELHRRSAVIGVRSDGELYLHSYTEAASEVEQMGTGQEKVVAAGGKEKGGMNA